MASNCTIHCLLGWRLSRRWIEIDCCTSNRCIFCECKYASISWSNSFHSWSNRTIVEVERRIYALVRTRPWLLSRLYRLGTNRLSARIYLNLWDFSTNCTTRRSWCHCCYFYRVDSCWRLIETNSWRVRWDTPWLWTRSRPSGWGPF